MAIHFGSKLHWFESQCQQITFPQFAFSCGSERLCGGVLPVSVVSLFFFRADYELLSSGVSTTETSTAAQAMTERRNTLECCFDPALPLTSNMSGLTHICRFRNIQFP